MIDFGSHWPAHVAAPRTGSTQALLKVRDLELSFGGIVALSGISFDIQSAEICGLIGPNGAGKTSLFNCLSRLYTPRRGEIFFGPQALLHKAVHDIAGLGIARTFQNLALFDSMTVLENVLVGAHSVTRSGYLANGLWLSAARREEVAERKKALELIAFLGLDPVAQRLVGSLPFGTRKRVELARALASRPKLLLLDEPAGGLNHEEVGELQHSILRLRREMGLAILLVEHHLNLVMKVSDKVIALNFGRKIAEGTPAEVQRNPEVASAYMGEG